MVRRFLAASRAKIPFALADPEGLEFVALLTEAWLEQLSALALGS